MKKIAKIIIALTLFLAPLAISPVAMAKSVCEIGYTGPDSNNVCTSTAVYTCKYNNINEIVDVFENKQLVASGISVVVNNTSGGDSLSGSATNENNVTFNVTVTPNIETESYICAAISTIPAKVVKEQVQVAPTKKVTPTVLPTTSGNLFSTILTTTAIILGVGVAGLFLGVTAYRLFQS